MIHGSAYALLLTTQLALASTPADAVAKAVADARTLPPHIAEDSRYLSMYNLTEKERENFVKALNFHVNSLSSNVYLVLPVYVTPDLCRVYFLHYGWKRKVWEQFADIKTFEPYFHFQDPRVVREVKLVNGIAKKPAQVTEASFVLPQGARVRKIRLDATGEIVQEYTTTPIGHGIWNGRFFDDGWRPLPAPVVTKTPDHKYRASNHLPKKIVPHAPWVDPAQIIKLAKLTNSDAPIVRADWFIFWTSLTVNRNGAGYYDFLNLKDQRDAEKLAGLDRKQARILGLERHAVIDDSGVALNSRQIIWFKTLVGSWWETLDSDAAIAEKNALRLFDGDFVFQASEVYFNLPNRLWGLLALNAVGELQVVVPNTIAGDGVSTSNDKQIHGGTFSCVRCHAEGIRPFKDWVRSTFEDPKALLTNGKPKAALASVDPKVIERFNQIFFSDIEGVIKADNIAYTTVLKGLNGLTPGENSGNYALVWTNYFERKLDLEVQAREHGTTVAHYRNAIEVYASQGNADQVLVSQVSRKPSPLRREHFEELFALTQSVLQGVKP